MRIEDGNVQVQVHGLRKKTHNKTNLMTWNAPFIHYFIMIENELETNYEPCDSLIYYMANVAKKNNVEES